MDTSEGGWEAYCADKKASESDKKKPAQDAGSSRLISDQAPVSPLSRQPNKKIRSLITHEARSPPSRQPALARHSPHLTSHRDPRPTHPLKALRTRPPAQRAPRPQLPCPAQPTASSHCAHPNNTCPACPPTASHKPSSAREPGSRPISPLADPWIRLAPSLPTPSLACQPVRLLLGRQLQCLCCERGRSAQATAKHMPGLPRSTNRQPQPHACSASGAGFIVPRSPGCQSVHLMGRARSAAMQCCCSGQWEHTCIAAHMHCRHTCIAAHIGQMLCCCGFVPRPARAGLGWAPPLNGCSQGLVVRGICPLSPVFIFVFLFVIKSLIKVSNCPRPSILSLLPRLTARRIGGWLDD